MWSVAAIVISLSWAYVGLAAIKAMVAVKVNSDIEDLVKKVRVFEDEQARFRERVGRLEMKR